jgi:hypothetical protein
VDLAQSPSSLAQLVIELRNRCDSRLLLICIADVKSRPRLNQHETRIFELEKENRRLDVNPKKRSRQGPTEHQQNPSPSKSGMYHSPESSINGIHLGPPIATLRSLRVLAEEPVHESTPTVQKRKSIYDPTYNGLLSVEDVGQAIEMYVNHPFVRGESQLLIYYRFFQHCHASAPVLDESIHFSWQDYLERSPTLILTICSIGLRFWEAGDRR